MTRRTIVLVTALLLSFFPANAQPRVPEYVVFAGDTVRMDSQERYEKMDRALITVTYMHTTSTLMLRRSHKYFEQVVPILRKNGLPEDLKYIMVIESSLDPKAVSPAGAAGLWQFMKKTAQAYGLEVNDEVDERYNTVKATEAACTYFKTAYAKYHDWMTVAASYNGGIGGISKKLEDQHQKSAMDLWLVEETARYMYRIMATKMLIEDPASFGFMHTMADEYPYIPPRKTITVDGPVSDLVALAEQNGVTFAQLKAENLWLRDTKLTNKDGKRYKIAIPEVVKF